MFCPKCGNQLAENSQFCPSCGTSINGNAPQQMNQQYQQPPVTIKTHMVDAIIVTLFCCVPFGIVAIVYASKVSSCIAVGDIAGAQEASRKASTWAWLGAGLGIVGGILYGILTAIGASV